MNAVMAVDAWMNGNMTIEEVMAATGHESKVALLQEYLVDQADIETATRHYDDEAEDEERELRFEAYQLFQQLLAEEPGYLPQIMEALRKKKQRERMAVAAKLARGFKTRRRSMHNVVQFRRS